MIMKRILPILCVAFTQSLFAQTPATDSTLVDIGYVKIALVTITVPVTHVDARQFNQGLLYDWNQLWQGQVAGLLTARPGSNPHDNFETRIHGLRTSGLRTQPLYVLDGVPGVDIYAIDPADIASVEVLRGAAASAIYGGRGAAGIVLLHTKTPQKGRIFAIRRKWAPKPPVAAIL
jgi:TonB-dependent starch-binding outer membrane protein SusC